MPQCHDILGSIAHPKRKTPVTDEERKERNRRYQHTRRHKTNNGYSRAYNRASARAADWFREHQPAMWEQWLNEELLVEEEKPYAPTGGKCAHDGEKFVAGVTIGCVICGHVLGNLSIDQDTRAMLTELPEVQDA